MLQSVMKNSHGRLVFPSNFIPELDVTALDSLDTLEEVIQRDFESKAPSGTEILQRIEQGKYARRSDLLRDIAMNLFWTNRYAMTMYDKHVTRWKDVPRNREDVYIPALTPWEDGGRKVEAVREVYPTLDARWDATVEDEVFKTLFDVFAHRRFHATELSAIKPTVEQILADPSQLVARITDYDPNYPVFRDEEILDVHEDVPQLEALRRWSMVLHNQFPWDRSKTELVEARELRDEDYVIVYRPKSRDVQRFIRRATTGHSGRRRAGAPAVEAKAPVRPYKPIVVRDLTVQPRILALAVAGGEEICTNDDLIRNSAYNWSPMTAEQIVDKTGIRERLYTFSQVEDLALNAARSALDHAGVGPEEVGAVIVATCTNDRLMPSIATYVSGELGIHQTNASYDLIAACAGLPYALAEATRILQDVERPVLVVCAEKFSDKIGNVRPSRMIFGDGAAALLIGVAPEGETPDLEYLNTYASGPVSQVNSIIWPNPEFDNNLTVYGPEVKDLAGRYLAQMLGEISELPDPDGRASSLLDSVELIVPHQANKSMVIDLATKSGLTPEQLFFNIDRVGNTSSASIPLAIFDAVRDGVIDRPTRIFAPGFGAGSVAGYAIMRVDPAVMAAPAAAADAHVFEHGSSVEDVAVAFN
ncbi:MULTISPECIES: ketoacyl-ACP synthase III [Micrococcaceae]|uniref:ketoacyl-ACP synthase III n=1 Tax=Micrococcaceae TaxID=1268 RepID=UPI00161B69AC|nr:MULTISPECIES: ketoacyl-ACP synthase III [Micrococcaceae]MBB5747718.1 3-oxoacyl-(acyl-carrier-protein) synthase III [Micrococcus sp. TA1]HRO30358.1 ketoacyl-ACP synthase III [Citricoccus sp.]HRO93365.1 ketoacyl-ACP synthase III [Citricoccus sp.]